MNIPDKNWRTKEGFARDLRSNSYHDLQEIDNIWKTQKEKLSILFDGSEEAARAGAHTPPDSPCRAAPRRDCARASLYQKDQRPEPVWNTGGHLPPARPCLAGPSPLGKILQNFQGHGPLSPPPLSFSLSLYLSLSTDNSSRCAPASSTSLIRLRILRVATIFSRTCFDLVVVYGNKISFRRVTVVNFVL